MTALFNSVGNWLRWCMSPENGLRGCNPSLPWVEMEERREKKIGKRKTQKRKRERAEWISKRQVASSEWGRMEKEKRKRGRR